MLQITVLVLNLFTSPFREAFESSSDFPYLVMLVASIFQPRKWDLWSLGQKALMNHEKGGELEVMWLLPALLNSEVSMAMELAQQ